MKSYVIGGTLIALALGHPAQAQYRKYKSKTKFSNVKSSAQTQNAAPSRDYFNRDTGANKAAASGDESSKFVNLNFETAFGPEVVTGFEFPNANLLDLTKHMQKLTGINLIWEKDIKGKVSIMAQNPITVGDAWKAYLTALNINGYTLVKTGAFYKIVSARDSRSEATRIYTGAFTPDTDNYIMKILPIKYIQVDALRRNLRPFNSKYGRIIPIKDTNTVILLDKGSNVKRLVRLLKFLDVPGHKKTLHIIPVKNSSAEEIVKILNDIIKEQGSSKIRSSRKANKNIGKIQAEPRTNSIIALADADGFNELRELVKRLDVKVISRGSGKVHVYYLNYGDAEKLAKTLTTLVSTSTRTSSTRRSSRFSTRRTATANSLFSSTVKLTADKDNNALVVTASPTDWLTLKNVISKLDIPREQVFVEGMIMETNVSRQKDFGISIVGVYGDGGVGRAGFSGPTSNVLDLLGDNITNLTGLFVGAGAGASKDISIGGNTFSVKSVNGLIKALAADNNTNVLATPQIMALDNEEAEFEVGEQVPIRETTNNSNGTQQNNFKLQDVTMKIKITPQINKVTRFIKLKIDQNIKDFSQRASGDNQIGAATTVRRAVTTVVCRDQDTVAMGGLMRDQAIEIESKVPLLGDIPVLGWLFKQRTNSVSKVNLLFFLTPKIMAPYGKTTASTLKDVMNRRAMHLKEEHAEDDPFATTAKGIHQKAQMQEEGPLYDKETSEEYLRQNNSDGIGNDQALKKLNNRDLPDYRKIYQQYAKKNK